jgi:hypothetical protein
VATPISRIGLVSTTGRKDMTADCVPPQISLDPQSGRILNTAQGILIGLRRCRSEAAFQELLVAAQRQESPPSPWHGRLSIWPAAATNHPKPSTRRNRLRVMNGATYSPSPR